MTYNVFSGTLNPTQSVSLHHLCTVPSNYYFDEDKTASLAAEYCSPVSILTSSHVVIWQSKPVGLIVGRFTYFLIAFITGAIVV